MGSRRACDKIIADRRVSIDGVLVEGAGEQVIPDAQVICVDGQPVSAQKLLYFLLNKPKDVLCTNEDTHDRKTYLDLLPELPVRVFPVGRLDRDSEGLLLITNDGALANHLMHPRYEVEKVYEVLTGEPLTKETREHLCRGIIHDDDLLVAEQINPMSEQNAYEFRLREGKNRHIRRMVEYMGNEVLRLRRVSYGPLTLTGLKRGEYRALNDDEVQNLRALVAGAKDG